MILNSNSYVTESVLKGHPDKMCDQISDAVLDEYLKINSEVHTAIECMGFSNHVILAGEINVREEVDIEGIVRRLYKNIGYTDELIVHNNLSLQSKQLQNAVDCGGAGDQGIMYGYACDNEYNFLPVGVYLSNILAEKIDELRNRNHFFLPDGKIQIMVKNNCIKKILINVQHSQEANLETIRQSIMEMVIKQTLLHHEGMEIVINKDLGFVEGGFSNDTGLTGRKIMVDTYGGLIPHGGGAFSGKDPSKMDRTGAYMARYVAKSVVANGYAKECLIMLAYEFGEEKPVMVKIDCGDEKKNHQLVEKIKEEFDFRPDAIIERLMLRKMTYLPTSTYGHFTKPQYPWEKINVF